MFKKLLCIIVGLLLMQGTAFAASVSIEPGEEVISGQNNIDTAGTAEQLVTGEGGCKSVLVLAHPDNVGVIYVGNVSDDVASGNGLVLHPGSAVIIDVRDPGEIYVDAANTDDDVCYLLLK